MPRNDIFPILDVSCLSDNYTAASDWEGAKLQHDVQVNNLVEELSNGFSDWGFLYVKGHGIPQNLIDGAFIMSEKFFRQEKETKINYKRGPGISEGYVPIKGEVFDEMKPEDIKEAFDFLPNSDVSKKLSQEMPEVVSELSELFKHCSTFLYKLLRLLAVALGIDTEYFVNLHTNVGNRSLNGTSLRTLFYPQINGSTEVNQRRCSEHTDYGTITLLFQDNIGGLEVLSPSGEFVKAFPIPGTIVINAADLLHTWSNGKFRATTHRVQIPTDPMRLSMPRQSIAFFAHPNYDVTINYQDENGKAKTRNAYEHLKTRFDSTIVVENEKT
ncbi:uncharacterized protein LOC130636329 [Hydractinia symbiolongicarpus]|uniref:uncharacterized protein LOC130636329 n=1 Tax=Hydractinia symbiolongicarpus TaxID=13093 RepID=UPI00255192DA|nr:uncharacterized protein LOC130636329 [Hydractinia symbiolongicarpus]